MRKYISAVVILLVFTAGFLAGCTNKDTETAVAHRHHYDESMQSTPHLPSAIAEPHIVPSTGTIEVAFSPNGGAAQAIVKAIGEAKRSVKVQAYSFTNKDIARALLRAKNRGVNVEVILDKSQEHEKYSSLRFFANNNIPVKVDKAFRIAHNKIMIIDDSTVITGSFNFTNAAQHSNAENLLIIRGNKELAKLYLDNWQWRWNDTNFYK